MKLQIINDFGVPQPLVGVEKIKIILPYENGKLLEKSNYKILDEAKGKIEFELSDFEIQGLKIGLGQTFLGEVYYQDHYLKVAFTNGLNVELKNDRKVLA